MVCICGLLNTVNSKAASRQMESISGISTKVKTIGFVLFSMVICSGCRVV